MDLFLYDKILRLERVKGLISEIFAKYVTETQILLYMVTISRDMRYTGISIIL